MAFSGIAFGLPFAMNSAEGVEASMFVAAAAARSSWRRALVATGASLVTLLPVAGLIWVIFHFVGATYLDYAIAVAVFLLGLRALKEGFDERPAGVKHAKPGPIEPIGLAAASAPSVREFQAGHGLETTGVIGEGTRVAIRIVRAAAGYEKVDRYVHGVDVADAENVARFQQRHGLPVTGNVDAVTRGALRVAQQQGLLDALDSDCVARFQADHQLRPTGYVDEVTAVAVATVRAEGATAVGEDGTAEAAQAEHFSRWDPVEAMHGLDAADATSIKRFQACLGLVADGVIGDETRGALLAARARVHPDPGDPEEVRRFQSTRGLASTGVIDEPTRGHALASLRVAVRPDPATLAPDPADSEAVCRFQRFYGLEADGAIGPETRAAIRHARHWFCNVHPTDERSVRAFQKSHALLPDGIIGPRTQAALTAERARIPSDKDRGRKSHEAHEPVNGPRPVIDVDLADPEAVRAFQAQHHLEADGIVGPLTREALAVASHQRTDGGPLQGGHGDEGQASGGPVGFLKGLIGDAWPAYVGVTLETSEAILYSFAVASSSVALLPAAVGAGIGFSWPWATIPLVRKATSRVPEWKQELIIGLVLVGVAVSFGILHAAGVFR